MALLWLRCFGVGAWPPTALIGYTQNRRPIRFGRFFFFLFVQSPPTLPLHRSIHPNHPKDRRCIPQAHGLVSDPGASLDRSMNRLIPSNESDHSTLGPSASQNFQTPHNVHTPTSHNTIPTTHQGSHLRAAENVMDKLSLLGWPGDPTIGEALALLSPPSSNAPGVEAVAAWLLPRVPSEQPADRRAAAEAKGGGDRSTYQVLVSAVARLGVVGLDPEELRRGHGPVRGAVGGGGMLDEAAPTL